MKQKQLLKTLLAAVCLLVGTNAWGNVITYDLTGKFSGTSTDCQLSNSKITTPEAIANELNKNATYSFVWSGSPRAKGDKSGVDVSKSANGTFTINGLSGGEMIIVKLHPQNNSTGTFTVAKGQKCVVQEVDVESDYAKTVSSADGSYVPIYMKNGATSLTVTSASAYTILESVTISTANNIYERNVTYGDANMWNSADIDDNKWKSSSQFSVDVPSSEEDESAHHGLGWSQASDPRASLSTTASFSLTEGSKVKYNVDWYVGGAPGTNKNNTSYNHYYLQFGNKIRISWSQSNRYSFYVTTDGTCSTSSDNQLYSRSGTSTAVSVPVEILINRATNTVERFVFNGTDYTDKVSGTISDTYDKIIMGYERNTSGNAYNGPTYIESVKVTEYSQHQPYTINYTYEGSIIKSEESTAVLGSTVNATYTTSLWNDGNTQKYYVADNATTSFTIAENGNIFNIALREAASDAVATVNAVDAEGNVLATFTGGSGLEGEAYNGDVYYTRAVLYNGQYYAVAAANGSAKNYAKSGLVYGTPGTVTYTLDETITYYTEVENLVKSRSNALETEGQAPERASGGHWYKLYGHANGGNANLKTQSGVLTSGVYTLEVSARGQSTSGNVIDISVVPSNGATSTRVGSLTWENAVNAVYPLENILVPSGAQIMLSHTTGGTSNVALDYIILRKVRDLTDVETAIIDCKKYETSDAFATYIDGKNSNNELSTAADVYAAHTAWQIAQAEAASSNDITKVIRNAAVADATDWDGAVILNGQQYTGAPDAYYIDRNGADIWATQWIYGLPAGKYQVKVATRANADTYSHIYVSYNGEYDICTARGTHASNTGNELGNGWAWTYVPFEITETANIKLGFYAATTGGWASCDDWHLYKVTEDQSFEITSTSGWATLYTPYALDFSKLSESLTAYTATFDGSTVQLEKVTNVPAKTGVVLKGSKGNYNIPLAESSSTPQGDLKGSPTWATSYDSNYKFYYLALNAQNQAQFKLLGEGGSIAAGKAYLQIDNNNSGSAKALSVVFANDPTGIANVNAAEGAQPAKRIVNGQLVIEKNGKRFNAAGAEF